MLFHFVINCALLSDSIEYKNVNPLGDIIPTLEQTPPMMTRLQLSNSMNSDDFTQLYNHEYWSQGLR